ncbi:MAG: chemotaxis response regulator protein-glutamate methylesterase [Halopseudomonas sp.]
MSVSKLGVLIVDDSAVVRQVVSSILASDPAIEIIGTAADPLFARKRMDKRWPDVIVLDIEMPRKDGITFLHEIMAERPTPVVICSSLAEANSETMQRALAAGAVDIITKPKLGLKGFLNESGKQLIDAVKAAGKACMKKQSHRVAPISLDVKPKLTADAILPASRALSGIETTEKLVAIGTSTGGTQALERVLTALPRVSPGIVIVQHMPEKFTAAFAERLNGLCQIQVEEARHQQRVLPGHALIAPGGKHLVVKRNGAQFHVEVVDGPLVNRHRPSVDVLFRSVAACAGQNALGVIMTGMGDDGMRGMLEMRQAGAITLAQDEASCVVFGMPKEAIKAGAVQRQVSLDGIPSEIINYFQS